MKKIFSGVQPSGIIHIGNYLGAIKQWVALQDEVDESIFCVVDLHAITMPQEPEKLRENIFSIAAIYLAAGIDPQKSTIFVQSSRPEHAELAWILNTITGMGELSRMTQFKDKSQRESVESASVGLFDYPVLMAADILLYGTTDVPVGEDQKQHLELARDLAIRFNNRFGQTFVVPNPMIKETSGRIMGLDDPSKKMSKSAASPLNYIAMTDDPDTIRQKIKRAVTDSGNEVSSGRDKPAISNLLNIYSEISAKTVPELENEFLGKGYGEFKDSLAEAVIEYIRPFQEKYEKFISDKNELARILEAGSTKVAPVAQETLASVKEKMGLGI